MKSTRWSILMVQGHTLRLIVALSLVAIVALHAIVAARPTTAQEPPRPTQRFVSTFPVSAAPAQYDLVEQILDFPPGRSRRSRS